MHASCFSKSLCIITKLVEQQIDNSYKKIKNRNSIKR